MHKKHIHFIGIGGIGMSGIAKILKLQGHEIFGCDINIDQKNVKDLIEIGCKIFNGNNTKNCNNELIDILVCSSAIQKNSPEILFAQKNNIPVISRAKMLAKLMENKLGIAIAGSHGKTTTTAMISHILIESKKDPTIAVGGNLTNLSTNAKLGSSNFFVAEADESDKSLLELSPKLAILTNIDIEHLDIYKDIEDIKQTFLQFLKKITSNGKAFLCIDDFNINSIMPRINCDIITFGLNKEADIHATNLKLEKSYSSFKLWKNNNLLGKITIPMPGKHNVLNALAAISVAIDLEVDFNDISNAFKSFKGIDRRFSFKGKFKGAELFDDYGHHPTEILNTLLIAKKRTQNKLIVFFQPQRYSRTQKLWSEFINVFSSSQIDNLVITDIYPASELPIENVTSENLVLEIKKIKPNLNVEYVKFDSDFNLLKSKLKSIISENDLLLTLGAGKINKLLSLIQK